VTRADASPLGLRAFHVVVFLGFAGAAIAGMLPELRQLFVALTHPWHFGTPPSPLGAAAALIASGLGIALLVFLVRGRVLRLVLAAELRLLSPQRARSEPADASDGQGPS
jgi:hypothetical protein